MKRVVYECDFCHEEFENEDEGRSVGLYGVDDGVVEWSTDGELGDTDFHICTSCALRLKEALRGVK